MGRKIILTVLTCLSAFIIGLFIYELISGDGFDFDDIRKFVLAAIAIVVSFTRILTVGNNEFSNYNKRDRQLIEESYQTQINNAFSGKDKDRIKAKKTLIDSLILFNQKKYPATIKKLRSLLKKCKTNNDLATVYFFIAVSFSRLGMTNSAIENYREALKYDDSRSFVWSNLGYQYSEIGQHCEATDALNRAIYFDPKNDSAYSNLAYSHLMLQSYENAIECSKKALEINSKTDSAMSTLALAYSALGDTVSADKYYKMYVVSGNSGENLRIMMNDISANIS